MSYTNYALCVELKLSVNEPYKNYSYSSLLGVEFKGYKGQAAIDKLVQEKRGHVKGAFMRKNVGKIDVAWGDNTFGLQKIINKRESEGFDGISFLSEIPNVIMNGALEHQSNGRYRLSFGNNRVILAPNFDGKNITLLLTAYERY